MTSIQEIIFKFEQKQISSFELVDALCRHESWFLEIDKLEWGGYTPRVYEDDEEKLFLAIFSSKVHLKNFLQFHKFSFEEDSLVKLNGYWLFQNLPNGIEYLSIDSKEKHSINYNKEQFELLKETAKLVELDIPILQWQLRVTSNPDPKEIKEIFLNKTYFLVKVENFFPLAPDEESRKLFPVFHTNYSAIQFVMYLNQKSPNSYEIVKVTAEKLFDSMKEMELDGFVLNPLGPVKPRAFHKDLIQFILKHI